MAELQTIARPYAKAAFLSAKHSKEELAQWLRNLNALSELCKLSDVADLIATPKLNLRQKFETLVLVLEQATGVSLTNKFKNFIHLLLENRKLACISAIYRAFDVMKAEHEMVVHANLISALPVSKNHEKAFKAALTKRFNKQVELQVQIDPSLIGGAIIQAGDLVIDGSLRGQLSKLQASLSA